MAPWWYFRNDPYPKYYGGSVSFVHKIDVDRCFILKPKEQTKDLGYAEIEGVYHRKVGHDKEDFLKFQCDKVLLYSISSLRSGDTLDLYVSHVVDDLIVLAEKVQVIGGADSSIAKNNEAPTRKPDTVRDDNVEKEIVPSSKGSLKSFSSSTDESEGDIEGDEGDEELQEA